MPCVELSFFIGGTHFIIPRKNSTQPSIKKTPPKGVMIPIPSSPTLPVAFKNVSRYNDPENKSIPMQNEMPAHLTNLFGNFSNTIATASKARA